LSPFFGPRILDEMEYVL